MVQFWKEILKMSIVPIVLVIIGMLVVNSSFLATIAIVRFVVMVVVFSACYGIAFWLFSMSKEERNLVIQPLKNML